VVTTAGDLPARWVIHTVGPVYSATQDQSDPLRSCYRESLRVAVEIGARSVAFPTVSAGAYGWPVGDAARQAVAAVRAAAAEDAAIDEVRFVTFSSAADEAFARALSA